MTPATNRGSLPAAATAALCFLTAAPCARATYITPATHAVTPAEDDVDTAPLPAFSGLRDNAAYGWQSGLSLAKPSGETYDSSALPQSPNVVVPEPATIALLGLGVICLTLLRRKPA